MEHLSISWMLVVLLFGTTARSAPAITFPLNSQVPPAARVGELFTFEFSSTTFSSDTPITYSLANHPPWLSVDSGARKLYGTPRDEDLPPGEINGVPIELVATDAAGATTLSATLVVSRNPAPKVEVPLSDQIANFGPYSEPGSILEYPGKPFSFVFAPNTFSRKDLDLYAVSGNNSPLPAWIAFDPTTLTFTGTTPPFASLIEPPQLFSFQLLASDVTGFSAAGISFSVIVGNHELTVHEHNITINATAGSALSYTGLAGNLRIDGKTASQSDVSSATAQNAPSWITFDPVTWAISGTPPADAVDSAFSVLFTDAFHDTANVTIKIDMTSRMFKDDFPELKVRRGEKLSFDLKSHIAKPDDVEVKIDVQPAQDWLKFDAGGLTLNGDVPTDLKSDSIDVSIQITSKTTKEVETQTLKMSILSATASTSETATATSSLPTSSSTTPTQSSAQAKEGLAPKTIILALTLTLGLLLIVVLALACCCYCRRRRRRLSQRLARRDITGPQPGGLSFGGNGDSNPSLKAAKAQFDVGAAATLPRTGEKGKAVADAKGLRRSRTNPGTPQVPRIPPLTGPGGIRSFGKLSSPGSWFGTKQKASNSKSFLSDGSVYDDDNASLDLLMHGKDGSEFRSSVLAGLPPKDPTSSIQHTPDLAYGTTPSPQRPVAASPGSRRTSHIPGRQLRRSHQTIEGVLAADRARSSSPQEDAASNSAVLSRPRSRLSNRPSDTSTTHTRRSYRPTSKPPQLPYPYRDPYPAITPERRVSHLADPFVSANAPPAALAKPTERPTTKRSSRADPVVNRSRAAYVRRPVSRRGDHNGFFAGRGLDSPTPSKDGSSVRKGKLSVAESWALKKQRASRDREHRMRLSRGEGDDMVGRDSLGITHGATRRGDGASERSWMTTSGTGGGTGEDTTPELEQAEAVNISGEGPARANWRVVRSASPMTSRAQSLSPGAEAKGRSRRTDEGWRVSARSGMLGEELGGVDRREGDEEAAVGTAVSRYSRISGEAPSLISADEGYQENTSSAGGLARVGSSGASSTGGRSDVRVYI